MAEKNANTWLDTPDPQVFIKNSARFNDLMMMYRCTVREVRTKLEVLNDEFSVEYKRNPISFIKTRIKKPESIYKKLKKLGYDFTAENIQNQLNDVAGIRVVCAFIDDIYTIADLIAKQDDITIIKVKDYIKNPKPQLPHNRGNSCVLLQGKNTHACGDPDSYQWYGFLGYPGTSAQI